MVSLKRLDPKEGRIRGKREQRTDGINRKKKDAGLKLNHIKTQTRRESLQSIYPIKDLYPDYMKNSQNSLRKNIRQ